MTTNNLRKHRNLYNLTGGLLSQNILLVHGLEIACAVGVATSAKNALALSIAMFFTLVPTMIISSLFSDDMPYVVQISCIMITSIICLILSSYAIKMINTSIFETLGIYFPIMAVNSALLVKSNQYSKSHKPIQATIDGIINSIGFTVAVMLLGTIREVLSNGTIWGNELSFVYKIPAAKMPFLGFIILAFIAAGAKYIGRLVKVVIFKADNKKFKENKQQ